jgi:hypothetical protein
MSRSRAIVAPGLAAVALGSMAGAGALADSFTPVQLGITIAQTARRDVPLPVTVQVTADAGALDANTPLWLRVKLSPECAGTWAGTPGTVLINRPLSPQPPTGRPYSSTMSGSGRARRYGIQTVCVWVEEQGDNRVFATSQAFTVNVLRKRVKR